MTDRSGGADAQAWAFDAVESVSRTFALSIDLLEEPMSAWVCTGYLLCRVADTVEDEPRLSPDRRADLLDSYEAMLDPEADTGVEQFLDAARDARPADGGPGWDVVARTDRVLGLLDSYDPAVGAATRDVGREMAGGMAAFLREYADEPGLRLRTVDELEEYCWYVAGTVGQLFTRLLACRGLWADPPDPDDARAFALLLQLVNIAKDVGADRETEGNVYLPREWLAAEGIDHDEVARATPAVVRVVERTAEHAAAHAEGARRYLRAVPDEGRVLEAAALPYLLAVGTLRELRDRPADALDGGVKLDRAEVEALHERMARGVTQAEVSRLAERIRAGAAPAELRAE
ncbi:MAG: phytoene/squalene synthase family protein [Halobacteriaceae archaeon]